MDGAIEQGEREKWNQRYLEGTQGTLQANSLLIQAYEPPGIRAVDSR